MKIHQVFIRFHRILGSVLSILFLMWFVSGMVMMYHTYPSLSMQERMAHAETLDALQPMADSTAVCYERVAGRTVGFSQDGEPFDASTGQRIARFSAEELQRVARRWTTATPTLIDTLSQIDVWLIGAMPFSDYPVYHYALNDGRGGELYLSSRTGHALQLTDSRSRFWAWVGAIPHWIYVTKLRATGRQPWTDVVLWLSGLGIAMVLSGLVVGTRSVVLARRRRLKKLTPYAKPLFRWHHLLGLCFGLFVLTWIFSGFMSLADAPRALWPVHDEHSAKDVYAKEVSRAHFRLDVSRVVATGGVKRVELMEMGRTPYYHVWAAEGDYLVDATRQQTAPCVLDVARCKAIVSVAHGDTARVSARLLDRYDNYYVSQKQSLPLPVCRVKVDDSDGSTYYINPRNGDTRYYNHNRRAGKWMYTGLHALNIAYFADKPVLRRSVLWVLLLGGTAVSVTGLVLGCRYVRRRL